MSEFENSIKKIMKEKVEKPLSYEYAIKNAFNRKKVKKYNNSFLKIATATMCLIMASTGVIAGSYIVYEKVWKEPKKIDISEQINETHDEITNAEVVSNENIEEKIKKFLNILGFVNINEYQLELRNAFPQSDKEYYMFRTDVEDYNKGLYVYAEKENKNITYFYDNDFEINYKILDSISEKEAIQKAENLLKKLDIFDDKYELTTCNNDNNVWVLIYSWKNENGIINNQDCYRITFGVVDDEIKVKMISNSKKYNYQDNELIISKEEAIKIVEEKEKEFLGSSFKITVCELGIKKINTYIYELENDINVSNDKNYYKVDDISRNVWIIKVEHEKENSLIEFESFENYKKYANKYYYVDVTTGEIVGGKNDFDELVAK